MIFARRRNADKLVVIRVFKDVDSIVLFFAAVEESNASLSVLP